MIGHIFKVKYQKKYIKNQYFTIKQVKNYICYQFYLYKAISYLCIMKKSSVICFFVKENK